MDCIFCKIINNEIPSKTLYEDLNVKVIMDINPQSNGHILILPNKHYHSFEDLDDQILIKINETAKEMKEHLYKVLKPDGLTLLTNYGVNQMVKHYHLHLIPTYKKNLGLDDVEIIYNKIKDVI